MLVAALAVSLVGRVVAFFPLRAERLNHSQASTSWVIVCWLKAHALRHLMALYVDAPVRHDFSNPWF